MTDNPQRSFLAARSGSIAVLFAVMVPVGAAAMSYGVDYVKVASMRSELQRIADSAALSSVREMRVTRPSPEARPAPSKPQDGMAAMMMSDGAAPQRKSTPGGGGGGGDPGDPMLSAIAQNIVDTHTHDEEFTAKASAALVAKDTVKVDLTATYTPILSQFMGGEPVTMSATATAEVWGGENICMISLEPSERRVGVRLRNNSRLSGPTCGVYTSSRATNSVSALHSSLLDAKMVCSAGGVAGPAGNFAQQPVTDCPRIPDPLASRPNPDVDSNCIMTAEVINGSGAVTLSPGTYCDGLTIEENADVWLTPGVYAFRGGPLIVQGEARFRGDKVGLYFSDDPSHFEFRDDAEIELGAPETGQMAGILIMSPLELDRIKEASPREFRFASNRIRKLLGTIYAPMDDIEIEATTPVAEQSAFTIIIADSIDLIGSPDLILNTDYAATTVPVPGALSGLQKSTRLIK